MTWGGMVVVVDSARRRRGAGRGKGVGMGVIMEIRNEWREPDQKYFEKKNDRYARDQKQNKKQTFQSTSS